MSIPTALKPTFEPTTHPTSYPSFNPSIQLIANGQINDENEATVEEDVNHVIAKIFNIRDWIFYVMVAILLFVCGALIGSIWMFL